ncbi:MAG: hypothetical protein LBR23_05285 [Spirochaetaceae bacterium]|nr:hypothetical protein [Spirochaetaceae bacterium]
MKKRVVLVVLMTLVIGGIFAQEELWGGKKNFVSAQISIIGDGLRYERFLLPKLSVGVDAYYSSIILWTEMEGGAFARYYLWKGLYGELGLGYHIHMVLDTGASSGVSISPGLGWKFDPGKPGGFFVEPGVTVPITLGENGVSVGGVPFCSFGWSF